jgi:hypothetical protein
LTCRRASIYNNNHDYLRNDFLSPNPMFQLWFFFLV